MRRLSERVRRAVALAGTLASLACTRDAAAGDADKPEAYYYKGYDYGSQALYDPLYLLVNRGFDVLQVQVLNRSIFTQRWLPNMTNIGRNVLNPIRPISSDGWGKWLREEIFPLSWTSTTARWVPNYGLHLIGGGVSYRELREWFVANDAPGITPQLFSIATLYTAALLNESLENKGVVGTNTDALADLLVFDVAGILLFSSDAVARFFSETVTVSDWSLQPSFTLPRGDLHNVGNYYSAKYKLPFYERLRLFGYMGFASMGGLSFLLGDGYSLSAAAGAKVGSFDNSSQTQVENVVLLRPAGALFLDRRESLLASVQVADVPDYFVHVNVYPNAIPGVNPGFGLWGVVGKDGRFIAGVSLRHLFGMGAGAGTQLPH